MSVRVVSVRGEESNRRFRERWTGPAHMPTPPLVRSEMSGHWPLSRRLKRKRSSKNHQHKKWTVEEMKDRKRQRS